MKEVKENKEVIEFLMNSGSSHPLTLQACKELSIDIEELLPKTINDFITNNNSKDIADVYFKHYEARRRAKLVIVAQYLIDNKFFKTPQKSESVVRSFSLSNTRGINCYSSQKEDKEQGLAIIKKNLMRKLIAEKNLKKL